MIRNEFVVEAWLAGRPAAAAHLWTDGSCLYSYTQVIGQKDGDVPRIVGPRVSVTTARHTTLVARVLEAKARKGAQECAIAG